MSSIQFPKANTCLSPKDVATLDLELSSSCELRLEEKEEGNRKETCVMPKSMISCVMDYLVKEQLPNLKRVNLHNGGKKFFHVDLVEMLAIIRRARLTMKNKSTFSLLTNAISLSPKKSQQIIKSRAVDEIQFDLGGWTLQMLVVQKGVALWKRAQSNICSFLIINEKFGSPITIKMKGLLPQDHVTSDLLHPQFKELLIAINKMSLRHAPDWYAECGACGENVLCHELTKEYFDVMKVLSRKGLVIRFDGSVTVVDENLNNAGVIGSILYDDFVRLAANEKKRLWQGAF